MFTKETEILIVVCEKINMIIKVLKIMVLKLPEKENILIINLWKIAKQAYTSRLPRISKNDVAQDLLWVLSVYGLYCSPGQSFCNY